MTSNNARVAPIDRYLGLNYGPLLPPDLGARILDIGCGDGLIVNFLADRGYHDIVGIDRDAAALAKLAPRPGVALRQMDIRASDIASEAGLYDLIVMREMIYYFPRQDMPGVMQAVAAALKPGGSVIIEAFNGSLTAASFTAAKDPGILTIYTEHSLRRLLEGAGLDVRTVMGPYLPARSASSILRAMARRLWITILKSIYILERGMDGELPKIYTKSVLAVGVSRLPSRLGEQPVV